MMWTPYQIEIMLHHHCSGAPFERSDAPAYPGAVKGLKDLGLLDDFEGHPRSTLLGQALIEMWCATPIPHMRFVDPRFSPKPVAPDGSPDSDGVPGTGS